MVLSPLCAKGTPAGVPTKEMKMEENKKESSVPAAVYVLGAATILTALATATLAVKAFTGLVPGGGSLRVSTRRQIS